MCIYRYMNPCRVVFILCRYIVRSYGSRYSVFKYLNEADFKNKVLSHRCPQSRVNNRFIISLSPPVFAFSQRRK